MRSPNHVNWDFDTYVMITHEFWSDFSTTVVPTENFSCVFCLQVALRRTWQLGLGFELGRVGVGIGLW